MRSARGEMDRRFEETHHTAKESRWVVLGGIVSFLVFWGLALVLLSLGK